MSSWPVNRRYLIYLGMLLLPFILLYTHGGRQSRADPISRTLIFIQAPLQDLVAAAVLHSIAMWDEYLLLASAQTDYRRAKMKLERTQDELRQKEEIERENERLHLLLNYARTLYQVNWIGARVISRETSPLTRTLRLNRGRIHGVAEDMAVINHKGVIGRISRAFDTVSEVLLITDSRSAIPAQSARTRAPMTIVGHGESNLRARYLDVTADVLADDEILTSGLGEVFPAGLLVGRIDSVARGRNALFATVRIAAAVDFNHLEEVLVLEPIEAKGGRR
jgi:rod shape-determining protein MreC